MQPFETLTDRGKARRLRKLALDVLKQYPFEVSDLRLVGVYTNTLFRVRTVDGNSYMLRICKPGWRTETDLLSEVMWLQALNRDTDIGVPQPYPARNGTFIISAQAEGIPGTRRCVLMSWITGSSLEGQLTEPNLYKMGVLFARLHQHTAGFSPPDGFTQRKLDTLYARGEEDILFGESCRDAFSAVTWDILNRVKDKVYNALKQLYAVPDGLRVIHNDLWHGNIKVDHGHLHPLDFEDTVWGYPVQDIAMALQDLMMDVEPDVFTPLRDALRAGYESRMPWPESYPGQIDLFRAGRMLWVTNYVARFERQYLRPHIEWLAPQFESFLETGVLRKG